MLIGDVFYYTANGVCEAGFDSGAGTGYAESVSKKWPREYVKWICRNGDPTDVRWFLAGKRVDPPSW